jgi:hypothetical protein
MEIGDRRVIVRVDEIEKSGLGIRVAWVGEARDAGLEWSDLLLWIPVIGALLIGLWHARAHDRSQRK